MSKGEIQIIKASGERERFDPEKLKESLKRAGAGDEVCDSIVQHILDELQDGMSTTHIYRHAFSILRKVVERPVAARYSMRRAVFGLGPTGFPFEEYVAEIYRKLGYNVETERMVDGKCAVHEVDMLAENGEEYIGAELKFHNSPGIKTDLKTALYVRERFDDIQNSGQEKGKAPFVGVGMLITNTKFTRNAIDYSKCAGLKLLGWNYPRENNLEDLIRKTGIYPITTLTSLTHREKLALLERDIVLCNGLTEHSQILEEIGVSAAKIGTVMEESQALCTSSDNIK